MSPHAQLKENGGSKVFSDKVIAFLKAREEIQLKTSKQVQNNETDNTKKITPVVLIR